MLTIRSMVIHFKPLALSCTLLCLFIGNLYGQQDETPAIPTDSTDRPTTLHTLLEQRRLGYDASVSPTVSPLYFFSERGSRTDISLGGALRRDGGEAMIPQLGKQDIDGSVRIESALRQRNNFAWGAASYTYRATEGIRFNETSDYPLLAPYVMGDTAHTACLHQDLYTFGAGTAHRFGNWLLSLTADYRATFAYRTTDPRPRNLATHLEGQLGIGYQLTNYALALTGTIGRYKQNNQVDFLSEVGEASEYHFTGIGGDYYRFRGNNTSLFYQGLSYGISLGLTPTNRERRGFYALASWHLLTTDRIIRELNNLPLSTLYCHTIDLQAGYTARSPRWGRWGVTLYTQGDIRRGAVHLFGDPKGNLYPRIATEHSYYARMLEMGGKGFWHSAQSMRSSWTWGATLSMGYRLHEEDLLPNAMRTLYHVVGQIGPQLDYARGRYMASLKPTCGVWLSVGHGSQQLSPQLQPIQTHHETLERAYQIACSTRMSYGVEMTHGFQLTHRYVLWLSLHYLHTQTKLCSSDYGAIRCGISF